MNLNWLTENLWGKHARFIYLFIGASILLFSCLGTRDIWTQEHRWAEIVLAMFDRHDYLHPYLEGKIYYDKPLLSYWLIVIGVKIFGQLNTWILRLPSAIAGLIAIWSIYQIGSKQKSRELGFLSGWLLLTTFYFIFWARISSADMLNLAGSLLAIAWYFRKKDQANFFNYSVFFIILALTSLCKGLVGAVVPVLAVITDIYLRKNFKQHLRISLFFALLPAIFIYLTPFLASEFLTDNPTGQIGLLSVYRENFLRYFEPFDHRGPIYTYFIYLPIYLFPWTILLIPALYSSFKTKSVENKWILFSLLIIFLFFTLSGSRRSYYVLPVVPFAILLIADWLITGSKRLQKQWFAAAALVTSFVLALSFIVLLPAWYYSQYGINQFVAQVENEFLQKRPRQMPNIVMLDAEAKFHFYFQKKSTLQAFNINGDRDLQTPTSLIKQWPILLRKPPNTIFISRRLYLPLLQPYFINYHLVQATQPGWTLLSQQDNLPIAFLPT